MKVVLIVIICILVIAIVYVLLINSQSEKVVLNNVSKKDCELVKGVFQPTTSGAAAGGFLGTLAASVTAVFTGGVGLSILPAGTQLGQMVGSQFQKGICTFYKPK